MYFVMLPLQLFGISFFFIWQDTTVQSAYVQNYKTGLTWRSANFKCGKDGLEHNATLLSQLPSLHTHQFWIGLGIYKILSPWMEVLGCYHLPTQNKIIVTSSAGLCQRECNATIFFAYKKHLNECMCLGNDINGWSKFSLHNCTKKNHSSAALVYEVFLGHIENVDNNWMCTTFKCVGHIETLYGEDCNRKDSNIHGLCEDGNKSSNSQSWTLPYLDISEQCSSKNMLLIHSKSCKNMQISGRVWTNIIRDNIEVELPEEDSTGVPIRCFSANISKSGLKDLQITQENCTSLLKWIVCKKNPTPGQLIISNGNSIQDNTEKEQMSHSKVFTGAIAGGCVSAITVLLIVTSVVICRLRRIGPFNDKSDLKKTPCNNKTNTDQEMRQTQEINHTYGIVNAEIRIHSLDTNKEGQNICNAQVNKNRSIEDTYIESVDGEYDHFDLTDRRRKETNQNTYDSHIGIRSCDDPTYDTTSSSRKLDPENVYNHSFSKIKTESDYDQSFSVMTETSLYDKTY